MTAGLDTFVVLRLLTGAPEDQAVVALEWLRVQRSAGVAVMVSDLVVYETYFALQHHFRAPKAEALARLAAFLASGDVQTDGVAATVITTPGLATAKLGFVDRVIHAQCLRTGTAAMATFGRASARLKCVHVLAQGSSSLFQRRQA